MQQNFHENSLDKALSVTCLIRICDCAPLSLTNYKAATCRASGPGKREIQQHFQLFYKKHSQYTEGRNCNTLLTGKLSQIRGTNNSLSTPVRKVSRQQRQLFSAVHGEGRRDGRRDGWGGQERTREGRGGCIPVPIAF